MNKQGFESLVGEFKNKVYNTCLGFVKNHEDAEDLSQEVFIEIYKKMHDFRGEASIGTWIYRIAVNKCLEHSRKQQREKRKGVMSELDQFPNKVVDVFYHPGVSLENKERSAILFAAIDSLPEPQRIAFTLQKVEGLSIEEISKVMLKTLSSIESLLHRAKHNLRIKLNTYYEKNG